VLEVENLSEYSAFVLPNPYRLIIDVHGGQSTPPSQVASNSKTQNPNENAAKAQSAEAQSRSILSGNVAPPKGADSSVRTTGPKTKTAAADSWSSTLASASPPPAKRPLPTKTVVDNDELSPAPVTLPEKHPTASGAKSAPERSTVSGNARTQREASDDLLTDGGESGNQGVKATSPPTSAPMAVAVTPRDKSSKKTAKSAAPQAAAAREAAPTLSGDRSLIRALGLKIGRIVIDAGHGGHDTGTIGPNGLQEKDLVLDISLRLGRLLENPLGADVIYTRDDDTFIPLETRTAIANEKQADLFISVHANSSPDPTARGVETYYLNFTSDADALEVAARENAVSQKSIHELQDLVKKITLKEKIEESRELASDVQQALYSGLSGKNSSLRNRGVKKAPFVVLIGANMPSILAEISFVSNPTDEQRLETPEYRQKIAEALYRGIAKYVGGLSGVKVAKVTKETGE
jgi:N-acetylmuramoyl-L-alanine amidase